MINWWFGLLVVWDSNRGIYIYTPQNPNPGFIVGDDWNPNHWAPNHQLTIRSRWIMLSSHIQYMFPQPTNLNSKQKKPQLCPCPSGKISNKWLKMKLSHLKIRMMILGTYIILIFTHIWILYIIFNSHIIYIYMIYTYVSFESSVDFWWGDEKRSILSTLSEVLGSEHLRSGIFVWTNNTLWATFNTLMTFYYPWRIHGTGIFTYMIFVDFSGKCRWIYLRVIVILIGL